MHGLIVIVIFSFRFCMHVSDVMVIVLSCMHAFYLPPLYFFEKISPSALAASLCCYVIGAMAHIIRCNWICSGDECGYCRLWWHIATPGLTHCSHSIITYFNFQFELKFMRIKISCMHILSKKVEFHISLKKYC